MLILTRKLGEQIAIGDNISVTLLGIKGTQVKLGIKAPRSIDIHRQEIYERIGEQNLRSSGVSEMDLSGVATLLASMNQKDDSDEG